MFKARHFRFLASILARIFGRLLDGSLSDVSCPAPDKLNNLDRATVYNLFIFVVDRLSDAFGRDNPQYSKGMFVDSISDHIRVGATDLPFAGQVEQYRIENEAYRQGKLTGRAQVRQYIESLQKERRPVFWEETFDDVFYGEEISRQFSPFEFHAKAFNESPDPDATWEEYNNGIHDAVEERLETFPYGAAFPGGYPTIHDIYCEDGKTVDIYSVCTACARNAFRNGAGIVSHALHVDMETVYCGACEDVIESPYYCDNKTDEGYCNTAKAFKDAPCPSCGATEPVEDYTA